MGIDSESDISANLQIGPTTLGMVRLYIEADGVDLPLDFDPDEAEDIAEELRAAAERARVLGGQTKSEPGKKGPGGKGKSRPDGKPGNGGSRTR